MQKSFISPAVRWVSALLAAASLFLLTGCDIETTNLTPDELPANPSQIYTITARFRPESGNILPDSILPRIVIDGKSFTMTKSNAGNYLWEFDYQLPAGRSDATYYFITEFVSKADDTRTPRQAYSQMQHLKVAGRYVLRSEAMRAPVGARVSVLGAGFTPNDTVYLDFVPSRTIFESPSSLSFFVPAVEAGKSYRLHVTNGGADLAVGQFRVDAVTFQVSPSSLTLRSGEQQALTFTIPTAAPSGGLLIEVTTDIPASVIMPEAMIAPGATSVTIPIQGGNPGSGSLFFKSSAGDASVPVTVTSN